MSKIKYSIKISLICFDCSDEYVIEWIDAQQYDNIEIVRFSRDDKFADLLEYLISADSEFVCFLEENRVYSASYLKFMLFNFGETKASDIGIAVRYLVRDDGTIIACPDPILMKGFVSVCDGKEVLREAVINNKNIYGDLANVIVKRTTAVEAMKKFDVDMMPDSAQKMGLCYAILCSGKVAFCESAAVDLRIQKKQGDDREVREDYIEMLQGFSDELDVHDESIFKRIVNSGIELPRNDVRIKKDITFITTCRAEYYNVEPIAEEAKKRGYSVRFTENMKEKAEIGVYCYHKYYPELNHL